MTPDSHAFVEQWWADVFDVQVRDLWRVATVHDHAALADYPGWWAAWRDATTHVSAPSDADPETWGELLASDGESLSTTAFWESFARSRGLVVIGPSVHAYLDDDPGEDDSAPRIDPALLGQLRASVGTDEGGVRLRWRAVGRLRLLRGRRADGGVQPHHLRRGATRRRAARAAGNDASRAIARELGFEDYAVQLAVRASRA